MPTQYSNSVPREKANSRAVVSVLEGTEAFIAQGDFFV